MIKVGITGCQGLEAAELVRVLINHPDVELCWAMGNIPQCTRLDAIVPGIIGECDLVANSGETPLSEVDVVFACGDASQVCSMANVLNLSEETHVIDVSGSHNLSHEQDQDWKYGLSEMQRRVLVHDAHLVTLPGCVAAASLLAVMPMARNLMLNSPLDVSARVGSVAFPEDENGQESFDLAIFTDSQRQEIENALRQCQSSFNQPVNLSISPLDERRTLVVDVCFKCGVTDDEIRHLYEEYYDDHNFVFIVDGPVTTVDVENTNKCLISFSKDDRTGLLTVRAVMDLLLKGGAGNAVHIMNLMFGLHERVGLSLKATGC